MPDPATFDYEGSGLDSETYDPTDEGGPEVKGCKLGDVGWMKAAVYGLMPEAYRLLQAWDAFHIVYERPPVVWVRGPQTD